MFHGSKHSDSKPANGDYAFVGSPGGLSRNLAYFQKATDAKHAFQVVLEADYSDEDCFVKTSPSVVSAKTFLSQLV